MFGACYGHILCRHIIVVITNTRNPVMGLDSAPPETNRDGKTQVLNQVALLSVSGKKIGELSLSTMVDYILVI